MSNVLLTALTVFLSLLVVLVLCVNFSVYAPPTTQQHFFLSSAQEECETNNTDAAAVLTPTVSLPTSVEEVTNDSTNATVMGMATGYNVGVYKRFVGSLRISGFKGRRSEIHDRMMCIHEKRMFFHPFSRFLFRALLKYIPFFAGNIILVIAEEPARGVVDYLTSKGVMQKVLKKVPCTTKIFGEEEKVTGHAKEVATCAHPYPYLKIRWGRFPLLRDYLQECEACTGPALFTDVRDAFFQRDPFGDGAPVVKGLQVFQEAKFQKTTHWLVKGPVSKCKNVVLDEIMLCSGTTIGTREAMLEYLEIMHREMTAWMKDPKCCCNKMNGDDQSIHNYLYYTGRFPNATSVPNRMGIVHTVGKQAAEIYKAHEGTLKRNRGSKDFAKETPFQGTKEGENPWLGQEFDLVDNEGFFLDYDGSRSRVVHQWDRFREKVQPWLKTNGLIDP